ncbi:MAG: nucleotidyltransferase domain-containing protein [Paludibacteraceae bacterium]|nr:nucleotidyltransferase domain-containing protein [Paludibacteraceae bacterium]
MSPNITPFVPFFCIIVANFKLCEYEYPSDATSDSRLFQDATVLKAWLFGSFARGEETPKSDVDKGLYLFY